MRSMATKNYRGTARSHKVLESIDPTRNIKSYDPIQNLCSLVWISNYRTFSLNWVILQTDYAWQGAYFWALESSKI